MTSTRFEVFSAPWFNSNSNSISTSEVLEGSSGEDEVEDKTFGRIFPRSRRGEKFFPFPRPFRGRDKEFLGISAFFSAILRTRLLILVFRGRGRDEARNFASFLGHFEVETRPSRTSGKTINNILQ